MIGLGACGGDEEGSGGGESSSGGSSADDARLQLDRIEASSTATDILELCVARDIPPTESQLSLKVDKLVAFHKQYESDREVEKALLEGAGYLRDCGHADLADRVNAVTDG